MARPKTIRKSLPGIWHLLRRLWPYIREQRRILFSAFVALFAGVAMRALEPWPLKFVFDYVIAPNQAAIDGQLAWVQSLGPLQIVMLASLALVLILLFRALSMYHQKVGFAVIGNRVLTKVRGVLFRHIQCLPVSFHNKTSSGDLLVRVMGDVGMLKQVAVTAFMPMIGNVLVLIMMASLMFWLNWKLALVALVSAPLYWIPTLHFGRKIQDVSRTQRKREGKMASTAMEVIGSIQAVQTLSLEESFAGQFSSQNEKSQKEGVKFRRLLAKLSGTVQLMTGISTALVLFYGTVLLLDGQLSAGSLLVFLSYLKTVFKPIQDFTKYSGRIAKASAAGERVLQVLDIEPDVADSPDAIAAPPFKGIVKFENVGYEYEKNHPVLADIDFEVQPGTFVAIAGGSGAGKSTLISMLSRLHDPTRGCVKIDGRDIRDFTLASLRAQTSVVLQDTLLFTGTIRENIALAVDSADEEDIYAAARLAQAHEFILRQLKGYETQVGERGVTLSVGQRQRIAIARAAINQSPLLILDEPTTGLDQENQEIVMASLKQLAAGRTTFMVTHDLRDARGADLIILMENGRIIESGSHDELIRADGKYARLTG